MTQIGHTNDHLSDGHVDTKINIHKHLTAKKLASQPDEDSTILAAGAAMAGSQSMAELGVERLADIHEVVSTAEDSIRETMVAARHRHGVGSWKREGYKHHLKRACDHLRLLADSDKSEPHLDHAICRLVMALRCRDLAEGMMLPEGAIPDRLLAALQEPQPEYPSDSNYEFNPADNRGTDANGRTVVA